MKTIQLNNDARDVEHDASVEVPSDSRDVLVSSGDGRWDEVGYYIENGNVWGSARVVKVWRELPAPPKPAPKIVPHSLEHWKDPKVERPDVNFRFVVLYQCGPAEWFSRNRLPDWNRVERWCYFPEDEK